jgi:XTP/dITP diphosphohydrolase
VTGPVLTLVIATRNRHKVDEIRAVLGDEFRYLTLADFPDAPTVVEDAPSFAGNAAKKARELARWLASKGPLDQRRGWWVLADDSGLEVDALGGAPGVHSARFAALDTGQAGNSPDAENNAKLLRRLAGVPLAQRTARFRCAIALAPVVPGEPAVQMFEGACEGRILETPRGQKGFGYDPLFEPAGFADTFGQMQAGIKNRISHRARALAAVMAGWNPDQVGPRR